MPIYAYVEGPTGSHSRYYPNEWDSRFCRRHYVRESNLATKGKSREELFREICANFSPSLRFFFMERFCDDAESWHTAKMNFTRSVAVNSFVGHVLGIGDRHLSNILIHNITGIVVHIDFGIVFEQGKVRLMSRGTRKDAQNFRRN